MTAARTDRPSPGSVTPPSAATCRAARCWSIDPWVERQPRLPRRRQAFERLDLDARHPRPLRPHGRRRRARPAHHGALVIANYDLCGWLASQGVERTSGMNLGGTQEALRPRGSRRCAPTTRAASSHDGRAVYGGARLRLRRADAGRLHLLPRRRHRALLRHGADRRALPARARLPADRRPLHHGPGAGRPRLPAISTCAASCRSTGGPSRCCAAARRTWSTPSPTSAAAAPRSSSSSPAAPGRRPTSPRR